MQARELEQIDNAHRREWWQSFKSQCLADASYLDGNLKRLYGSLVREVWVRGLEAQINSEKIWSSSQSDHLMFDRIFNFLLEYTYVLCAFLYSCCSQGMSSEGIKYLPPVEVTKAEDGSMVIDFTYSPLASRDVWRLNIAMRPHERHNNLLVAKVPIKIV